MPIGLLGFGLPPVILALSSMVLLRVQKAPPFSSTHISNPRATDGRAGLPAQVQAGAQIARGGGNLGSAQVDGSWWKKVRSLVRGKLPHALVHDGL